MHVGRLGSRNRELRLDFRYPDYGLYTDQTTLIEVLEVFPDEIETRGPKGRKEIRVKALISPRDKRIGNDAGV